jgi:hypothetical protein
VSYFHSLAISLFWQRHHSSAEDYATMIYYNLCGNGSQHSNISKGKGGGGGSTYKKTHVVSLT